VFDFCSVESAHPPEEFHRREAGGWEAESFVHAEVVGYTPPTQQSQSGGFSPSGSRIALYVPASPKRNELDYYYG